MPRAAATNAADRRRATSAVRAAAGTSPAARPTKRRRKHVPGFELDCAAGSDVPHVGIVFVHGIGSQAPGETLLDWGGAIIGLLLDVRLAEKSAADPVISCELDPAPTKARYIELQLPAGTASDRTRIPERHWVMTEAWWAQRVRPPGFGQMAEWLGPRGAISRILLAILPRARGEHDPRLRPSAKEHKLKRDDEHGVEESAKHGGVLGQKVAAPERLEKPLRQVARVGAQLYLQAISALILVIYGALRSIEKLIPIGPLKNGALTRPIDEFMLDWFGDVYVLLADPAQAASVRGRLVDALRDLHAAKCETVVVVAHSGGAIVSYMTLADPANRRIRVDRLITLGEGLNLAWLLTTGPDNKIDDDTLRRYERLYKDVFDGRPTLSWHDFWASQDPAPVGVLKPDEQVLGAASLGRIKSHAIWNRLAFAEDHGTYWQNDEEFLMPMVRLLDGSRGDSRVFGTEADDRDKSNRRRRRLTILSLWRQLSSIGPTSGIVVAFVVGSPFVQRASDAIAAVWGAVPGSEIVSGPINSLRGLGLESALPVRVLAQTGVWVIAALIGLVALFALLAPPERPVPWALGRRPWLSDVFRIIPWVVGLPIIVAVFSATLRFIAGATLEAAQIGLLVGAIGLAGILLAFAVVAVVAAASKDRGRRRAMLRNALEMAFTILVMGFAVFLALSPFVSTIVYTDTGRTVLGSLGVLAAFQAVGRIGTWRWNVWDGRERVAARTGNAYPRLPRVVVQSLLLLATLVCLFLAVVFNSADLTLIAAGGAAMAVLLGISIDVFSASRQERTTPTDMMLRSHTKSA